MSKYAPGADDSGRPGLEPTTSIADPQAGHPNALVNAASNLVARLRADDDQLALAKVHQSLHPKAIEKLSVEEARRQPLPADAVRILLRQQGKSNLPEDLVPDVRSHDTTIDGAEGLLPARIYTPTAVGTDGTGALAPDAGGAMGTALAAPATGAALILYFHGGGWVIADKDDYDGGARGLCHEVQAVVVSVDYRQAPEHKFPAAWDDALAAYRWVLQHAAELGADPRRIALAGESAGGNLAVATAIAARDAGLPAPRHVLAVYPVAQTSLNTESYIENVIAKPLNRAMVEWFVDKLIRDESDLKDPRLSLIDARLEGLPPVTIINARLDPLRSDGAKLRDALHAAGVPVERRDYEGVAHEFFGAASVLHKAREAQAYAGQRLRADLG